jgi:hypothetical protein
VLHIKEDFDWALAVRALMEAVALPDAAKGLDTTQVTEIITSLQENAGALSDEVCKVEWAYLPLLDRFSGASARLLERRLATDPGFFCEVVRLAFRSHNEEGATEAPSEERRAKATNAYRLLRSWQRPPGSSEDGALDEAELERWLSAVRDECQRTGHLEMAMMMLGHSLAHSPVDPAGLWIHRAAARALDGKAASDMRDGFLTEIINSRGAHYVDPTGAPEEALASQYRERGEAVELAGFHRLAATLRDVAASYERDAQRIRSAVHRDE